MNSVTHPIYSPDWHGSSTSSRYWPHVTLTSAVIVGTIWFAVTKSTAILFLTLVTLFIAVNAVGFAVSRVHGKLAQASLFNWVGSMGGALAFTALSPDFLPIAILCLLDGALSTLSLDGSSRPELRAFSVIGIIMLSTGLVITESARYGIGIFPPLTMLPLEKNLAFSGYLLGYTLTCVRQFRSFFDAIQNTLTDLQRTHAEMEITRSETDVRLQQMERLLEVSRIGGSAQEFKELLTDALAKLRTAVDYYRAGVLLLRDDALQPIVFHGAPSPQQGIMVPTINRPDNFEAAKQLKNPRIIHDLSKEYPTLYGSWMGVPLIVRGQFVGLLTLRHEQVNFYDQQAADLCLAFANQIAGIINSVQLQEAATSARVVAERHRLARELHDSVSQSLFGIVLGTRTAREQIEQAPAAADQAISYSLNLANAAISEMRALIFALRPETLERQGLIAALQAQIDLLQSHHGMNIAFDAAQGEPEASFHSKEALYRISTEAMQNAIRHSHCRNLVIRLTHDAQTLSIDVIDDGRGFDPHREYENHLGLKTMRERAVALGGAASIQSTPGAGTHVRTVLPR